MSEPKFTKGQWYISDLTAHIPNRFVWAKIDGTGYMVADTTSYHGRVSIEEMDANARLIAAAPELYEALEFLCRGRKGIDVKQARIVLAKARAIMREIRPTPQNYVHAAFWVVLILGGIHILAALIRGISA